MTTTQWVDQLTWCREEMECLIDIWADELGFPDVGHHARKQWRLYNCECRNERGGLNTAVQRQQYIKERDHTVHVDKSCFGLCCQAAHISAFCSNCWRGCVFQISGRLLCSYMCKHTESKGKHPPPCFWMSYIDPSVEASSVLLKGSLNRWDFSTAMFMA